MKNDSWMFNYRSYCPDDSDSDSNDSCDGSKHNTSEQSRLMSELDISTRPDAAVFKPNPFSIAKMNAFTRSSRAVVDKPIQVPEKPKNTGTIDTFFKKTKQNAGPTICKKPTAYKTPPTAGCRVPSAISPVYAPTNGPEMKKQISKPPDSTVVLPSEFTETSKPNVPGSLPNRRHQVNTGVNRRGHKFQSVSSGGNVAHTPTQVTKQQKPSIPVMSPISKQSSKLNYLESPSSNAVHTTPHGKENQAIVPYGGSLASARRRKKSPLPVISSTNDRKINSVLLRPQHISEAAPAITLGAITRSQHAPMKRPVKLSQVDSVAHIHPPAPSKSPKCYEANADEDESWSTLLPRKKFKPSAPMSKYKTTKSFLIPGLRHDANPMRTGKSATSSSRVITFLPTPLLADSREGPVKVKSENRSSPPSSPHSQNRPSFDFDDDGLHVPYSSPPTSDLPQADCDLNIRWDTTHLKERYAQVSKTIEEEEQAADMGLTRAGQ